MLVLAPMPCIILGSLCGDSVAASVTTPAPGVLLRSWLVMCLAMMPPLLARPVGCLFDSPVITRRWRALALFVAAYAAVWMLAGLVLLALAVWLTAVAAGARLPVLLLIGSVALAWQATPLRRAALAGCNAAPLPAPAGAAADLEHLRHGLSTGFACVGACWALMLLPLAEHRAGCLSMALVAAFLLLERQVHGGPGGWRLPWSHPPALAGLPAARVEASRP